MCETGSVHQNDPAILGFARELGISILDGSILIADFSVSDSKQQGQSGPDFFSTQVLQARRFFLNLTPAPGEPLVVVSGGVEHCAPDYAGRSIVCNPAASSRTARELIMK